MNKLFTFIFTVSSFFTVTVLADECAFFPKKGVNEIFFSTLSQVQSHDFFASKTEEFSQMLFDIKPNLKKAVFTMKEVNFSSKLPLQLIQKKDCTRKEKKLSKVFSKGQQSFKILDEDIQAAYFHVEAPSVTIKTSIEFDTERVNRIGTSRNNSFFKNRIESWKKPLKLMREGEIETEKQKNILSNLC